MAVVSINNLLEAGVHFGHQTKRWNPKMKEYIYTTRDDIHIIDLQKTVEKIEEAYQVVNEIAKNGGTFLLNTDMDDETLVKMMPNRVKYQLATKGAKFYVIDSSGKDFYPYKAPSTHRNLFLYLFIVCASIAVAEALIIGILFYRRRISYRRQVKPRRV